jgi:hypothetical protein
MASHVIALQDLVVNKRVVGRPQDMLDVISLLEAERALQEPRRESKPKKGKPKGRG